MGEGPRIDRETGQASIDYIVMLGSLILIALVTYTFYATMVAHTAGNLKTSFEPATNAAEKVVAQGVEGIPENASDVSGEGLQKEGFPLATGEDSNGS